MASLIPEPVQSYEDSNGKPLNGGKLFTYEAGTTTPKATYQDVAGAIPNANPIILNERGEATVYGSGNYRLVLQNSVGATIWDRDNVQSPDFAVSTIAADLANTTDPAKGDALVGVKQPVTGAVARNQHDKNAELLTAEDFGAVGDGVTDDTAALQAFLNALSGRTGILGPKTYISLALTFPGGMNLIGTPGASIIKAKSSLPNTPLIRNVNQSGAVNTYTDTDIVIDGVTFDGNNLGSRTAELVSISKVRRFRFSNGGGRNVGYIGMAVGGSRDVRIEGNEFTGCGNPVVTPEGGAAIWIGASGDTSQSLDVRVLKNYFHDNQWSAMYGSGLQRLIFSENQLTNNRESGVFINNTASFVELTNNTVDGQVKKNISASGFELGCNQVTITGNTIRTTGNDSISLTDVQGFTITGNTLLAPRADLSFTTASCIGIITTESAPNQPRYGVISGNTMVDGANNAYAAVAVGNSGAAVEFVHIEGNNMAGTTWSSGKAINLSAGKWASSCSRKNNNGSNDNAAAIGQFQAPAVSGSQVITGVGFRPSLIEINAVEASSANLHSSAGCARVNPVSGAITHVVTSMSADGSSGAGGPGATTIVQINSAAGAARSAAAVTAVGEDGFTLNWTIAAGQPWCSYKAYP